MLEVRGLRAGYGAIEVLRGVDLDVGTGEIVALLGSNGAGKSTLNNNISGLYRPLGGTIRFDGRDIAGEASMAIVDAGLIQVPEGRRVFPNLSVRENLELGSYRRGRRARTQNLERVAAIFPRLLERMTQLAGTLSGGEQQMLAIGRGLMGEPKLLILDEPSLGLSPILVEEMFALIARARQLPRPLTGSPRNRAPMHGPDFSSRRSCRRSAASPTLRPAHDGEHDDPRAVRVGVEARRLRGGLRRLPRQRGAARARPSVACARHGDRRRDHDHPGRQARDVPHRR
ncbi:MAG: ABC transporter ATP-binding protein [Alphaproteobacteria bacterium]|nr:ABC transporter ATP-binding protein [Alphaproteobacteria bacterium]